MRTIDTATALVGDSKDIYASGDVIEIEGRSIVVLKKLD
jgi:hypothetical protein